MSFNNEQARNLGAYTRGDDGRGVITRYLPIDQIELLADYWNVGVHSTGDGFWGCAFEQNGRTIVLIDDAALEADPHQWPASARDALNEWANRR